MTRADLATRIAAIARDVEARVRRAGFRSHTRYSRTAGSLSRYVLVQSDKGSTQRRPRPLAVIRISDHVQARPTHRADVQLLTTGGRNTPDDVDTLLATIAQERNAA